MSSTVFVRVIPFLKDTLATLNPKPLGGACCLRLSGCRDLGFRMVLGLASGDSGFRPEN